MNENESSFTPDPNDVQAKLDAADSARTAAALSRQTAERMQNIADAAADNAGQHVTTEAVDPVAQEHRDIAIQHEAAAYQQQLDAERMYDQQSAGVQQGRAEVVQLDDLRAAREQVASTADGDVRRDEDGDPIQRAAA
jgi:hypothetical protein